MSQSSRQRQPIQGLRQRLRNALRAAGLKGKFSTDHRRDGTLVVILSKTADDTAMEKFSSFEGFSVSYGRVRDV